MKTLLLIALITLSLGSHAARALEEDQVRGEVVSIDTAGQTLRVRVLDSGADIDVRKGQVETYAVPEGTPIEYEIDRVRYQPLSRSELRDIRAGDTLLLTFDDVNGNRQARQVRSENTSNNAVRDSIRREGRRADAGDAGAGQTRVASTSQRERLPSSASLLPALAVSGLFFAVIAGLVRRRRIRQS